MFIVYPLLTIIQFIGIILLYSQDFKNLALACFVMFFMKFVILDDRREGVSFVLSCILTAIGLWSIAHYNFAVGIIVFIILIVASLLPKVPLRNY